MKNIKIGNIVEVMIEEGHVVFYYDLKVEDIEENEFGIVAYGHGVTVEDMELAEEFTSRIDDQNFSRIIG